MGYPQISRELELAPKKGDYFRAIKTDSKRQKCRSLRPLPANCAQAAPPPPAGPDKRGKNSPNVLNQPGNLASPPSSPRLRNFFPHYPEKSQICRTVLRLTSYQILLLPQNSLKILMPPGRTPQNEGKSCPGDVLYSGRNASSPSPTPEPGRFAAGANSDPPNIDSPNFRDKNAALGLEIRDRKKV